MEAKSAGAAKRQVYLETSGVGYLSARPARDILTLADQLATREWWQSAAIRFDPVVSRFVLDEAGAGDPAAAGDRLAPIATLRILARNAESADLGRRLIQSHAVPSEAA